MRYTRVAERLFNRPLMISESKLNLILSLFGQRSGIALSGIAMSDEDAAPAETEPRREGYAVQGGLGIIGIYGPLMHRVLAMEFPSGGPVTYADIRKAFDLALADDGVHGIVLDIDSPGGEVSGAFDLADHIFRSRDIKPVTAIVNESAYSAAYLLASSAGKIVIPRTGGAGSIGVIATHADFSRAEDKAGVTVTHVYAGARKADFSPHAPLGQEAAAVLLDKVRDTYALFVETVARNRGLPTQQVRDTEAGIFEGAKAVEQKLADEVSAVDMAIKNALRGGNHRLVAASIEARGKERDTMTIQELKEQHPDLVAQIEKEAQAGMIAQAEADTAAQKAAAGEKARVLALAASLMEEERGKKLAAIVDANLTAEQIHLLGLSLAGSTQTVQDRMLEAITSAAPQGLRPAQKSAAEKPGIDTAAIYAARRRAIGKN